MLTRPWTWCFTKRRVEQWATKPATRPRSPERVEFEFQLDCVEFELEGVKFEFEIVLLCANGVFYSCLIILLCAYIVM